LQKKLYVFILIEYCETFASTEILTRISSLLLHNSKATSIFYL